VVAEQPVTLTTELPGRTAAYETSEVRPQVNGLVRARLFTEGDYVSAGQPLYQIDSSSYRAAVVNARGALANAQATVASSEALARRYGELVKINAISKQDYENALASARQVRASVEMQRGNLQDAEINLGRTTIRAPISGRIGISAYTTGALVTAQQSDALTTIQRLDPIYVDIQQSSADLLKLREQMLAGQLSGGATPVQLVLETGSTYPLVGQLRFADVTVDPTTGSQTIRAAFPNPQHLLLPGMFVRARLTQGIQSRGMLVPQAAVSRDPRGRPTVLVVGPGNKATVRIIRADQSVGDNWLVTAGLKPGDKVIVEAGPLLQPGAPVTPQPWHPSGK
jgi:membrane fusion protein (multidrug efflux system)